MKKIIAILLAIILQAGCFSLLFASGTSASAPLPNLITNGDFATADVTAGTVDGFTITKTKTGAATIASAVDTAVTSPAGSKSIRIDMGALTATDTAKATVYSKNPYMLKKSCYYEFSAWVKTQNSLGTTLMIYEPNYIKFDKTQATSLEPIEGQNIYSYSSTNTALRSIRKHINYTYTGNGIPVDVGASNASICIMRSSNVSKDASTTYDPQNTNNGWVLYKMTFQTTNTVDPVYNVTDDVPVCFAVYSRTQQTAPGAQLWVADVKLTEQYATQGWAEAEGGAGTVSATPQICSSGDPVTFTATPNSGNTFLGWYQNGTQLSTSATFSTNFNPSAKYVAKFNISTPVQLQCDNTAGTATANPAGGSAGTPITLSARPFDGNTFAGWYQGDTKISDDVTCYPNFDPTKIYTAKFNKGNLIADPGYEKYTVGTDLMGTAGAPLTWGHNSSASSDSWIAAPITNKKAYSGSNSLQVVARYQRVFSKISGLKPNTTYTLSFYWYMNAYTSTNKNNLSSFGVMPENVTVGAAAGSLGYVSSSNNATGNWQKAVVYFYTGANDTAGNIVFAYGSDDASSTDACSIYIDELAVFEGGPKVGEPINLGDADSPNAIKVLAIGNSFSGNATKHLREMAIADNVDLRVGNMSIAGCSLATHASNAQINAPAYDFSYYSLWHNSFYTKVALSQALNSTDWDYITIQQASADSGNYATTYQPYANTLINYIKEQCPNAKIIVHQTWAYENGYPNLAAYYGTQLNMWNGIFYSYNRLAQDAGDVQILPSGAAWQETRGTSIGDHLAIDGFHGNERGIMLDNYIWYEYFTGITPTQCKYDPTALSTTSYPITTDIANTLKEKAHFALVGYEKVHELITGIKELGTITTTSGPAIQALEAKYAAMTTYEVGSTGSVDYTGAVTNYATLTAARTAYNALQPGGTVKAGDINGDDVVDLLDITTLSRYVAGWPGLTVVTSTLDTSGDGNVDLLDITQLSRFVAGWGVSLSGGGTPK